MEKYANGVEEIFLHNIRWQPNGHFSFFLSFIAISNEQFDLRKLNVVQ
jgi:hypothetical protein